MSDREVEAAKEYATLLEDLFVEATAKSIRQEGRICALYVKLQPIEGMTEVAEEKVK